jgi:hypothetical protein
MPKSKHQITGESAPPASSQRLAAADAVDAYAEDHRAKTECYLSTKSPELHARVVPPSVGGLPRQRCLRASY